MEYVILIGVLMPVAALFSLADRYLTVRELEEARERSRRPDPAG